ncbi:Uncharacterized protein HZ326_8837 [Fusarium oxysporum f. sp. albedinis]|nr:Uncharacterized protein HZ326_8837 [Fusarium oxysporum f. sp. albedinis]
MTCPTTWFSFATLLVHHHVCIVRALISRVSLPTATGGPEMNHPISAAYMRFKERPSMQPSLSTIDTHTDAG